MRPPPGAGVAHTGRRWRSASATAASQAPLMSTSGPTTSTGFFAASRRAARSRTASGSATARPFTRRAMARAVSASSASTFQSSIGIETNAGPPGGRVAWWMARASAAGTSSARGGS